MKKFKTHNKVLSALVALMMLVTLLPTAVLADGAVTVEMMIVGYDSESGFYVDTAPVDVTVSGDTVTVLDILEAAADEGYCTYDASAGYVSEINGIAAEGMGGWMFNINDVASWDSADVAEVADGDQILWFYGTDTNNWTGPAWADIAPAEITAEMMIVGYDSESGFYVDTAPVDVTVSGDTVTVLDILEAAADEGYCTYDASAGYVSEINGIAAEGMGGWMFNINDVASWDSADVAEVADGDQILWFYGTDTNNWTGPAWADIAPAEITAEMMIVGYDSESGFYVDTAPVDVTVSGDTVTVLDILEAAADEGYCTYDASAGYVSEINGIAAEGMGGWMFNINDVASWDSADVAEVADGDQILWFYGTDTNNWTGPAWADIAPSEAEEITAEIMIVGFDEDTCKYYTDAQFAVTVVADAPTVLDMLMAAADEGSCTYEETSGFVSSINGIVPDGYSGWMFTVNDVTLMGSASETIVADGDMILWYLGAPTNNYTAPTWEDLSNGSITMLTSAEQLAALCETPEEWSGKFKLATNIDMADAVMSPIGDDETPFTGSINSATDYYGDTFKIQNLTIESDGENIGFFGVTDGASITDIIIENAAITGGENVGVLVGYAKSGTVIDNCAVSGTVSGSGSVGGIAGISEGDITSSSADVNVTGGTAGGFVGTLCGTVMTSYSTGAVTAAVYGGGFAGAVTNSAAVTECYSTGDVAALSDECTALGGFAASFTGTAENAVSAGTVTAGATYNGGFAGEFDGIVWAYDDDVRTLSYCYGNCVAEDSTELPALGDYVAGDDAREAAAVEEIAVDEATAYEKIAQLQNKTETDDKLSAEAAKYRTTAYIPATVQEKSDITALVAKVNSNTSVDSDVSVSYESEGTAIAADENGYTLDDKPEEYTEETVKVVLELNGSTAEQEITVHLDAVEREVDTATLLKNIMTDYALDASDYWEAANIAAYSSLYGGGISISADAEEDFVERAVAAIESSSVDTALSMYIIALRGLGYDPTDITTADGDTIDAVEKLVSAASTGNNGDAYRLLAYNAAGYTDADEIAEVCDRLISAQIDGKGWSNNYDAGIDPDSTGAVIFGLSTVYSSDSNVQAAVDSAVEYLSSLMQTDGNIKSSYEQSNYGTNANTSAIVALGLCAMGVDITSDSRFVKNGVSLYDGILSFADEDETGFVYEYGSTKVNALATKQAALAVMAAELCDNIFDFSDEPAEPIDLSPAAEATATPKPSTSSGSASSSSSGRITSSSATSTDEDITVYFSLVGDDVHGEGAHTEFVDWIEKTEVTVGADATVSEVIAAVLDAYGYTAEGIGDGYISSITTPDGVTLAEFDNGLTSGWMYSVNGVLPDVGIDEYVVSAGDVISLYYLDSYTAAVFADVDPSDWYAAAAEYVSELGLMIGDEDGNFLPDESVTRAMVVTVLARMAGADTSAYSGAEFADVADDDWFSPYVGWAAETGITLGSDDGTFAPNDSITREQLAAMLYRYADYSGMDISGADADTDVFTDWSTVSDWAQTPVIWAVSCGLISGYGDGVLAPADTATRAQLATILMNFSTVE